MVVYYIMKTVLPLLRNVHFTSDILFIHHAALLYYHAL